MSPFYLHKRHKKILHVSAGVMLAFLGSLFIFFSISNTLAAVTPIVEQDLETFTTEEQVKTEAEKVTTAKTTLETQGAKNKLDGFDNEKKRSEAYAKLQTLQELLTEWESLEQEYTEFANTLTTIDALKKTGKESDAREAAILETQKDILMLNINASLISMKKKDPAITLTTTALSKEAITAGKNTAKDNTNRARDALSEILKDTKRIYKEGIGIKKNLVKAKRYITDL